MVWRPAVDGRVGAVLVAAGRATRMGFDKIWAELGDRPVVAWSAAAISRCAEVEKLAVVVNVDRYRTGRETDDLQRLNADVDALSRYISGEVSAGFPFGGSRRRDSVAAGLDFLDGFGLPVDWVVVHDAARPFLTTDLVRRGLEAARETGAAAAALPVRDTVKRVRGADVTETLDRSELWAVQTPQVFRRDLLVRALASTDADVTDEATLVERLGVTVRVFPGEPMNFKITTPEDLEMARALVQRRAARTDAV